MRSSVGLPRLPGTSATRCDRSRCCTSLLYYSPSSANRRGIRPPGSQHRSPTCSTWASTCSNCPRSSAAARTRRYPDSHSAMAGAKIPCSAKDAATSSNILTASSSCAVASDNGSPSWGSYLAAWALVAVGLLCRVQRVIPGLIAASGARRPGHSSWLMDRTPFWPRQAVGRPAATVVRPTAPPACAVAIRHESARRAR